MTLAAGARLGPYEIVALAGAGGMGEVYRARDTRLDRTVAIKILPRHLYTEDRRVRFEHEARALSRLSHPRICALFDIGHDSLAASDEPGGGDRVDFLVMEYLEGDTLAQRLAVRPMRLDAAIRCAVEIAEALDGAHRQGFTHRDLKPGNIMLTATGVKLMDFGLAKWEERDSAADDFTRTGQLGELIGTRGPGTTLTEDGTIVGTIQYMAPEQLQGRPIDGRVDIFAFGAVLYEMIAGQKAFTGATAAEIATSILERDPPPLPAAAADPAVTSVLQRTVTKCLAKDPDDRWQTARDLASELRWIGDRLTQTGSPVAGAKRDRARSRWAVGAGLTLAVIGLVALATSYCRPALPAAPIVRFAVLPANGTTFSPSASFLTISPDGRLLAYLASRPGGQARVWVRSIDSFNAHELAGTDGALGPFWAPDNRQLGFFADSKVKIVDVLGGAPKELCAFQSNPPSGTWNRDGIILVSGAPPAAPPPAPAEPSGIYQLTTAGGLPKLVTSPDKTRGETTLSLPAFLPDGRHFIYMAREKEGDNSSNWVTLAALGAPGQRRLFNTQSQAIYADPGYLFFLRGGSLVAQPFDAGRGELRGAAIPVEEADQVGANGARGMFSISPTGALAYRSSATNALTWMDRVGQPRGAVGTAVVDRDPALSPDGRWLAVDRYDPATAARHIWVLDLEHGGVASQVTSQSTWNLAPVWSPDSARLIYLSREGSSGSPLIFEQHVVGGDQPRPLSTVPAGGVPLDWSRNGRFLIYQTGPASGTNRTGATGIDLWALPMTGGGSPIPLLNGRANESIAQLSPDGRWMAYESDESGRPEVYVQSFPIANRRWKISSVGGQEPKWCCEGRELFFIAAGGALMAVAIRAAETFEFGTPRRLFVTRIETSARLGILGRNQYAVSADGQRFLIYQPSSDAPVPISVVLNWRPSPPQ